MSSQFLPSSDRTRMNWTPMMERFFINLMLDQIHRGNRMGHTFNKQAWMDMLTMFNAKFGTKYDKDILKSHYTNLWKQYNDVKNLLEQNGFSWDDAQKMVIAEDHIWDSIIKAHPDALYYKKNSLLNFNDLCFIYAYAAADGRYSRSSHDVDLDEDIQAMNVGGGIGTLPPLNIERVKMNWTPVMDKYFIELMLEQLKKINRSDKTFSKQAWKDMLVLFNAKFYCQYDRSLLRHRYKKLFKYYTGMRILLERKGFSWDEKLQMIVADDGVWDKYVKAHPDSHLYRKKTSLNYQDLSLIYGSEAIIRHEDHMHQDKNYDDDMFQVNNGYENDGHSSAESDDLAPFWTLTMDCYLIDLLQDQTLRGNKIGHDLTAKAWIEVFRLFSSKFGSLYDEDVLKNRYKYLRRQYNGIKLLLEQNGFYWDENREMVMAESYVWNAYTWVHPDAQSYRNKSVPSYHKLCVIFGEESSNGGHGHRAHDVDCNGEFPAFVVGEDVQCHLDCDFLTTDWTPLMDRYFIDLLLEQVRKGIKIDYTSDNQSWLDMAVLFKERFGLEYGEDILKSRHQSFAQLYNDMKNILGKIGFSWDERCQLVTAHDDVWDAFIEEHPHAKTYRNKRKLSYNDLSLIYGIPPSDGVGNRLNRGAKLNHINWRNDWTPPMDRFFIDLMLQHVRQGSMIDQQFNKQAWSDMVAKFAAEFGLQYDKDVLKGRFMNLRKQFIDMRSLLAENRYGWDELQQRIEADVDVWNAYMKECPDAWSSHSRNLPNYSDLFMIYGNTNIGRHEFSSYSMADEHMVGINDAEEDGLSSADCGPLAVNWTKSMEVYFIGLVLEQVFEGKQIDQTLDDQAWDCIIATFNEKFGVLCDNEAVKSWYLSLMEEYNNIRDILNQDGFSWDEIEQKIVANDGDWKAYIKEHPGAIKYRDRILGSYNDLCLIYGNSLPVEKSSHLVVNMDIDYSDLDMGIDGVFGDAFYPNGEFEISDQGKKRKSRTPSTSAPSRKVRRPKMEAQAREGCNLKPRMVQPMGGQDGDEHISIEVIVNALQAIPDMDDELFLEACKILENERKAEVFVAMDVNHRRKWLFRKLCK